MRTPTGTRRRRLLAVGAVLLAGLGASGVAVAGLPGLSASLAVVTVGTVAWARGGARTAVLAGGVAVGSMTVTAVAPRPGGHRASGFGLPEAATAVELLALLVLLVLVARWVRPARHAVAAGALLGAGVAALVLRLISPASVLDLAGASALWALMAAGAATVGAYLRGLDGRRARSVAAARRVQRLELARDLHDFVAHDVSEMVAQAQAGALVAQADPARARVALERIEQSGLRALAAMDRTVHMLHDLDDHEPHPAADEVPGAATRAAPPDLEALREVAARFSAVGTAQVTLDLDAGPGECLPREVTATVHRVVVEALTNVRRHAPAATRVAVGVHTADRAGGTLAVEVTVTNDGTDPVSGARRAGGRHGGLGLSGLRERAEALGGTLTAGPHGTGGWQLTASLPLPVQQGKGRGWPV